MENSLGEKRNLKRLILGFLSCIIILCLLTNKGENMKKVILALFAVMTLAACTGSYKSGNCEYDFLLHKDISVSKIIGNMTGGC